MDQAVSRWLASTASVLVVPLLSVLAGYWLGIRRTKAERKWQATYEAYKEILGAVEAIRAWAEETYSHHKLLPSVGANELRKLFVRFMKAKRELSYYVSVGELLISPRAQEVLEELLGEVAREEFAFEETGTDEHNYSEELANYAEAVRKVVDRHVPRLLRIARRNVA